MHHASPHMLVVFEPHPFSFGRTITQRRARRPASPFSRAAIPHRRGRARSFLKPCISHTSFAPGSRLLPSNTHSRFARRQTMRSCRAEASRSAAPAGCAQFVARTRSSARACASPSAASAEAIGVDRHARATDCTLAVPYERDDLRRPRRTGISTSSIAKARGRRCWSASGRRSGTAATPPGDRGRHGRGGGQPPEIARASCRSSCASADASRPAALRPPDRRRAAYRRA